MKKIALLIALVSSPSFACNIDDMTGKWSMYFGEVACDLNISSDGRLKKSSCKYGVDDQDRVPIRGVLKMQNSCRITGKLRMDYTSPFGTLADKVVVGQSRMSASGELWTGSLQHQRTNSEGYQTFTAVRTDQ